MLRRPGARLQTGCDKWVTTRGPAKMRRMCGIGAILDPAGPPAPTPASGWSRRCATAGPTAMPSGASDRSRSPTRAWPSSTSPGATSRSSPRTARSPLIANGEIYNHRALRARLEERGHRFATGSDCEAILHAYEEHGPDCVRRAQRHLRLRPLGRPPPPARGRPRRVRRQAPLLVERRPPGGRGLRGRRAARRRTGRAPRSTAPRSTTTSPAASSPRPRTLFEAINKLPAASTLVVEEGSPPRVESWRTRPASPTAISPTTTLGRPARRALRRRCRAPDDVRRSLRRVPVRRCGLGRGGRRHGGPLRASARRLSRSASRATGACWTSESRRPRAPG